MSEDDVPPLDDFTEEVTAKFARTTVHADTPTVLPACSIASTDAPAIAATSLTSTSATTSTEKAAASAAGTVPPRKRHPLEDREFLTDWGTPEQEAMQKQMIDAALARHPDTIAEEKERMSKDVSQFGKGTSIKKGFLNKAFGGSAPASAPAPAAKSKSAAASSSTVPTIKPTAAAGSGARGSGLVMAEVQEAMKTGMGAMQKLATDKSAYGCGRIRLIIRVTALSAHVMRFTCCARCLSAGNSATHFFVCLSGMHADAWTVMLLTIHLPPPFLLPPRFMVLHRTAGLMTPLMPLPSH